MMYVSDYRNPLGRSRPGFGALKGRMVTVLTDAGGPPLTGLLIGVTGGILILASAKTDTRLYIAADRVVAVAARTQA